MPTQKKWSRSKTLAFFAAVFAGGGLDLIVAFINGDVTWRSFALLFVGLIGIGLRLVTKEAIK